jgi:hypothetical protein
MKTFLLLLVLLGSTLGISAQNATKSTLAFNHLQGLSNEHKEMLDSVYHHMSDLNYHFFNLASDQELALYQQPRIVKLIKARATKVMAYYEDHQGVETQNLFIKYGGRYPTLWLHKPVGHLQASGNVVLDDINQQCYAYNPAVENIFVSDNGNKYFFPPYAFETADGKTVRNRHVNICLHEFMDKKSLVYSGLTTDANGKMLETSGSFYIEASVDGEKLQLKNGENYTVQMTAMTSFPDMFTYYGGTKDGLIDWSVNPNERAIYTAATMEPEFKGKENIVEIQQQMNNINYDEYGEQMFNEKAAIYDRAYAESERAVDFYEMSAGKLGWINCDRFYEVKNKSTLAVKIDSDESLVVRLVFRNINSVMPCYANSNHKDQYQASDLPAGEKVLLLAYSVKDEQAVFGYKEIVIGENKIENITLNNLSKTRFKSAVSELLSF